MTHALLITEADGTASWAQIPYSYVYRPDGGWSLQNAWDHVRKGYTLRCNSQRPRQADLRSADWGLDVVFNPDYIRSIAAFPIYS